MYERSAASKTTSNRNRRRDICTIWPDPFDELRGLESLGGLSFVGHRERSRNPDVDENERVSSEYTRLSIAEPKKRDERGKMRRAVT